MRLQVHDWRASRAPAVLGICASDLGSVLSYLNEATQRLLMAPEVGDEGWFGSYAKVVFNVDPNIPYITAPREVARLSALDVCRNPIRVQNQWFEFLDFGPKLQKQNACDTNCSTSRHCTVLQAYDRGIVPTPIDPPVGNKIRLFYNNADNLKTLFFQGTDQNGNLITSLYNGKQVNGFFMTLDSSQPFVDSAYALNSLSNIAKDITQFPVSIYAIDPATGNQLPLATFAPSQTSGSYRRYFLAGLPDRCNDCDSPPAQAQVTAMAKLEFVPMTNDTDFLIIGNLAALKEECMAIRFGEMDVSEAETKAARHHKNAIRLLNGELAHMEGKRQPALNYRPFGRGTLQRAFISMT